MGLPLYRAPVESDIKSKSPKDPPTRARSSIRRLRRTVGAILHHNGRSSPAGRYLARRTGPAFNAATDSVWLPWDSVAESNDSSSPSRFNWRANSTNSPQSAPRDAVRQPDPAVPSTQADPALREVISRGGMSPDVFRYFGERMARLHADTSSRSLDNDERGPSSDPSDRGLRHWVMSSERPTPLRQSSRTPTTPHLDRPTPRDALPNPISSERLAEMVFRQDGHVIAMRRVLRAGSETATRAAPGDAPQESPVDGLGDRDRSLSPEGDGVWDTLLSSITPDPQPPSVGTSFASTSAPASAATSRSASNSARSSSTSLTAPARAREPDVADIFDFDNFLCESSGETDTEGDDEEESGENTLRPFGSSYAEVVGRSEAQSRREEDDLLSVDSMQRIVRNLARREDIPDEWWAEVGLSRSLSREAA